MSNTPEFKWDDKSVRDFINFCRRRSHISDQDIIGMDMGVFKSQHSLSGREVLFTTEDGVDVYDKDRSVYWVLTKGTWEQENEKATSYYRSYNKDWKVFSSQEARAEYILMNKPCLSAKEVIGILPEDAFTSHEISRLAQSKINPDGTK